VLAVVSEVRKVETAGGVSGTDTPEKYSCEKFLIRSR